MNELIQLQHQFQALLLSGQSDIRDSIVFTKSVSIDTRLGIYRDGYRLRLIENLSVNFPALYAYLGTEQFSQLARYYIDAYPSVNRSIRWFGERLAELIQNKYPHYEYLAELADFEWHMTLAFDAKEVTRLQVAEMAAIAPEAWADLCFMLHPALYRLNYSWNVISLWQALTGEHELPELQHKPESTPWVLWRNAEYRIHFYSLSAAEAWALDHLAQGLSFGALCEGLCQWIKPKDVGLAAASYLKGWIQKGLLAKDMKQASE